MNAKTVVIFLALMLVAIFLTLMYMAYLESITPKEYRMMRKKREQNRRQKQ